MSPSVCNVSRLIAAISLVLALCAAPALAQKTAKSEHAEATLLLERASVTPGDAFVGALRLKLADGWHVYWKNAGDSGMPPAATWKSSSAVSASPFRFQTPHALPLPPLMDYGYEREATFLVDFKVAADVKPGDQLNIGGLFDYLICSDVCIPEQVSLSVTTPVAATPGPSESDGKLIAAALADVPVAVTGEARVQRVGSDFRIAVADSTLARAAASAKSIRFFPNGPEVANAASQTVSIGPNGIAIQVKSTDFAKPGDQPLGGVVGVEGADGKQRGWEVAATVGAAPAGVADKPFASASTAPAPAPPAMGFAELALTLGLAFLGGLVLNLMPCVLPVLTIKAAGLVHTAHNPRESRLHGLAYLGGVLVCFAAIAGVLIALKAAGDSSAGLGFQLQYGWVTATFALVMFAIGLNLLGVFEVGSSLMGVGGGLADRGGASGAFFTGLLAAFVGAPCVGPFMATAVGAALTQPPPIVLGVFLAIGLGLAAPFVVLSFTPAFAKVLPKPGRWMATFRQVLAFPMFITGVWLLWVLSGQDGGDGVIAALGGATVLAFGIWLAGKIGAHTGGKVVAGAIILAGFATAPVLMNLPKQQLQVEAAAWSPQTVSQLRAENRVIFVDFTARWCVTCQFNRAALNDGGVQDVFKKLNVAFLEADWTNKDATIAAALAEHGRAGVPLYLVYPAGGGEPAILDQLLNPGMIMKAVRDAAGTV